MASIGGAALSNIHFSTRGHASGTHGGSRLLPGIFQLSQSPRSGLRCFQRLRLDLAARIAGAVQSDFHRFHQSVTRCASGRGREFTGAGRGFDGFARLFEFLFHARNGKEEGLITLAGFRRQRVHRGDFLGQAATGLVKAGEPGLQRIFCGSHFVRGFFCGGHHQIGLLRDRVIEKVCLLTQIFSELFETCAFIAKAFGQVARIVGAGISYRFQTLTFVANFGGHRFHRRQGMSHRAVDFAARMRHLIGEHFGFIGHSFCWQEQTRSRF